MAQGTQAHDWWFGNHTTKEGSAAITTVCRRCGEARVQPIYRRDDQHVDLTGNCPGEPQVDAPEEPQAVIF